ncbi:glycosyltransferase involved in cell wall biosynthesis [Halanaerobium sp. DL-01]|uniref:glycosyltransferase family 2 protein n=1 Tax=Halanaerobium sp. DL-01 TaxID=1653064 RepID=UPI000E1559AB|nr:glycosyltransferase family 2 protein [Halanaerobium sp. DL-01]RCW86921.1 glycosyltransferase involved in cell wall biosynthesis [Halanaerobium sp. DL-01]
MSKPKVSILIPTYNRENLIRETIESALKQTYNDYEIVIVDNKSTDNTYEIIRGYSDNNEKIVGYQNEKNLGPVGNWKIALQKSSGKYVKFLWSDDLIDDKFLEKTVPVLDNKKEVGFVYTKTEIFTKHTQKEAYRLGKTGKYPSKIFVEGALTGKYSVPVSPGCGLFRKKDVVIIDKIPNNFNIDHSRTGAGPDLLMFLEITNKYPYFYFIDDVLSFFRSHNESFSIANDLSREYNTAIAFFIDKNEYKQYQKKFNSLILLKEIRRDPKNIFKLKDIFDCYYTINKNTQWDYFFILNKIKEKFINRLLNRLW